MRMQYHNIWYRSITIYGTNESYIIMTLPEIGLQINYFNTKKLVKISLFILILFTVANRVLLKKFTRSTMDNPEPLSFRWNKWEGSMPFLLFRNNNGINHRLFFPGLAKLYIILVHSLFGCINFVFPVLFQYPCTLVGFLGSKHIVTH